MRFRYIISIKPTDKEMDKYRPSVFYPCDLESWLTKLIDRPFQWFSIEIGWLNFVGEIYVE